MTRLLRIALAIVPLLLVGGAVQHFAASGHDGGGSSFTPVADTPTETTTPEAPPDPEPRSEPTTTTTTAPAPAPNPAPAQPTQPAQPAQPVTQAPPQQTAPAPQTGPQSMTACVTIYGQRICQPYQPPSGRYPSTGNSTAPNVTQYYPSVSKDPIRNPNVVHPRE
jgi:hypothetical protein